MVLSNYEYINAASRLVKTYTLVPLDLFKHKHISTASWLVKI